MAHLLRAQPDAVWVRGYVTVGADLRTIDQNTFVAINGDAGGTWTPAGTLTIGGAGMVAAVPWTATGAGVTVLAPTFNKGTADDYFGLANGHAGRSQTLPQVLFDCYSSQPEWVQLALGDANFVQGLLTTTPGVRFLSPIRVFNGGTLQTITLRFVVGAAHAYLPTTLPQMRIIAIDANGNVLPLASVATGADAFGFRPVASPATGAAWYNSGLTQLFTYTCDQNNVLDISKYSYFVEIIEESGTNAFAANANAGNLFVSVTSLIDTITLFDGRN